MIVVNVLLLIYLKRIDLEISVSVDSELIHYRLTEVEEKVKKIDGKLNDTVINLQVLKTELGSSTGKLSSVISVVISVAVGVFMIQIKG